MRNLLTAALLVFVAHSAASAQPANGDAKLSEHLKPLAPFIGKTWRGDLTEPGKDKPAIDIAKWERALNGNAIRIMHSVNDGMYGGESIIFWDKSKQTLAYYYFTTAEFFTHGTMKVEGRKLIAHEYVTGNDGGITEVKSTNELKDDGTMHVWSTYFKEGKWTDGHTAVYHSAPDAKVVFK